MAESAAPQHVIEDVFNGLHRVQARPFRLFENRWQKWALWTVIGSIVGIFVSAVLYNHIAWPKPQAPVWFRLALGFQMLVTIGGMGLAVASLLGAYRLMFPLHRAFLSRITTAFTDELALITRVHDTYTSRELAYALDRLMLLVGQYRARTALLVGTLDKVGIIPLAVGAYFSARAFFREQPPSPLEFNLLVWMSSGLGALYVGTVVLLHWVQRCDEVCLVLKHAMQMHSSAHPKAAAVPERSGDQPAEVAPGPAAHHDR